MKSIIKFPLLVLTSALLLGACSSGGDSSHEESAITPSSDTPISTSPNSSKGNASKPSSTATSSKPAESSSQGESQAASSSKEETNYYTITFNSMGGSDVAPLRVKEGGRATKPADPTKEGYSFGGWYLSEGYVKAFDFATSITTDYVLFAKWNGGETSSSSSESGSGESSSSSLEEGKVEYWIAGDFCGWNKESAIQMDKNESGDDLAMKLGVNIEAGKMFKITNFQGDEYWWGYNDSLSSLASGDSNGNIVIKETGTYDIYLNQYQRVWVEKKNSGGESSSSETPIPGGESSSSEIIDPIPGSEGSSSSETGIEPSRGHGPEGSSLVSWYLVGDGSFWQESKWSTEGGIQLFSNPNSTDKCCILGIDIAEGDLLKITDGGTNWIGFSKATSELGQTNFENDADDNLKCKVSGTYDFYLNSYGNIWIDSSTK